MRRFRPYFRYIRPHRGTLALAILCGLVYAAATGAGLPLMADRLFPVIFGEERHELSSLQLVLVALWLPAVFVVRGIANYANTFLVQSIGTRMLEAIRCDYFAKLQALPLSFFHRFPSGELLSRGLADANQLQVSLTMAANEIVRSPATLVAAFVFVGFKAYQVEGVWLVLASLAVVPLSVLPIRFKKLVRRAGQIQAELGAVTDRLSENLAAAREVRAFNLEAREQSRFAAVSRALVRALLKFAKYDKALSPLIEIVASAGISLTLIYAYKVQLDQQTFLALVTALYACYEPIKKLGLLNNELKRGASALDRLEDVLNTPVGIADAPDARALPRARGEIAFAGVKFSYGSDGPALVDVSVRIPVGTVCALVGPSGAGKSTFANLVPRFFDPIAGSVTLDGDDLRTLRLADLRRNVAIVAQEPLLFNDTIRNNLQIARPEATPAEVEQAARDAFAHDFIAAFPDGYETVVGERGARLSGGQKQRVALARAFLRNAPILILDEATSALDSDSEAAVQQALRKLVVGKTVLIIAHRFSTIRDASMILVFDHGRIVAQGDHASLYAGNKLYRSLYDTQQGGGA
jgi:ATP-binding cassette, subfamily B, bacterial MsbA